MASGVSSAMRRRLTRATRSPAESPSTIVSSGEGANTPRSSQTERTFLPRRAMSSVNEVSCDSDCSTRSTLRRHECAGPVPLHQQPGLHQILHRLAHRHARNIGHAGNVALRGQGLARLDQAFADSALQPPRKPQIDRPALQAGLLFR